MFQNIDIEERISEEEEQKFNQEEKKDIKEILKKMFTVQNTLVYIVSFMLSLVSTSLGLAPFGMAIFAAVLSNGLPAGVVFAVTLIRNLNSD